SARARSCHAASGTGCSGMIHDSEKPGTRCWTSTPPSVAGGCGSADCMVKGHGSTGALRSSGGALGELLSLLARARERLGRSEGRMCTYRFRPARGRRDTPLIGLEGVRPTGSRTTGCTELTNHEAHTGGRSPTNERQPTGSQLMTGGGSTNGRSPTWGSCADGTSYTELPSARSVAVSEQVIRGLRQAADAAWGGSVDSPLRLRRQRSSHPLPRPRARPPTRAKCAPRGLPWSASGLGSGASG